MKEDTCFEAGSVGVVDETQECTGESRTCRRHRRFPSEYARGVADERARVVADLRRWARNCDALAYREASTRFAEAADRYERGEHERKGT